MKKNNLLLGALLVVALVGVGLVAMFIMAFVLLGGPDDAAGVGGTPTRSTAGQAIVRGSGSGNDVSRDFSVPAGCPRQELAYSGAALDTDVESAWANFRPVDTAGQGMGATMGDFLESPSGRDIWTLDAGRYALEVEAFNAEWEFKLSCR